MQIRQFEPADMARVIALWLECGLLGPDSNPEFDIQLKRSDQPELFLVMTRDGQVIGTVLAGFQGVTAGINYVAVAPNYRRRGIGAALVREAERLLVSRGCQQVNLKVVTHNSGAKLFYHQLGYRSIGPVRMRKRFSVG
ncbi:MAG: GNAT family acetyltransferase [Verrucomicrobia bacterium]|nr:GNAT family acetyltransferase [Verrucomicrobiota bacterium]MBV8277822.1 GNAT family acetyltransferase [Verrucomicrobiota bacterium]